jgi:hypothetical protein
MERERENVSHLQPHLFHSTRLAPLLMTDSVLENFHMEGHLTEEGKNVRRRTVGFEDILKVKTNFITGSQN